MEQLRSLSPETSITDDPLDQVSDHSFERMEKLCELLDNEELKEKLPSFVNEQEEAEYILSLDNYFKNHADELSQMESFAEAPCVKEEKNSPERSISDHQQEIVEVYDTLEEVDFILSLGNQEFSTPKCTKSRNNINYLKIPATESRLERPDMRNVTFRKKHLTSSIPRYQNSLKRSISLSPSCRTQVAVSHSTLLSPFRY